MSACVDVVKQSKPRTILAVGEDAELLSRFVAAVGLEAEAVSRDDYKGRPAASKRYDVGVAWFSPASLSDEDLHCIARMRDLDCRRVYVVASSALHSQLLALGFRPCDDGDADETCYEFDIAEYKRRPEWLNSKYWAHPERWGKDRW